jgi:hypothetical protein
MDTPDIHSTHDRPTDLDLEILDLLRENGHSARRLSERLDHAGERVDLEVVRSRLEELRGLGLTMRPPVSTRAGDNANPRAVIWRITEEGRALVEPQAGVARAPYERTIGTEDNGDEDSDGRDAELWVLVAIAVVTGACALYSLLTATGVLGGG